MFVFCVLHFKFEVIGLDIAAFRRLCCDRLIMLEESFLTILIPLKMVYGSSKVSTDAYKTLWFSLFNPQKLGFQWSLWLK